MIGQKRLFKIDVETLFNTFPRSTHVSGTASCCFSKGCHQTLIPGPSGAGAWGRPQVGSQKVPLDLQIYKKIIKFLENSQEKQRWWRKIAEFWTTMGYPILDEYMWSKCFFGWWVLFWCVFPLQNAALKGWSIVPSSHNPSWLTHSLYDLFVRNPSHFEVVFPVTPLICAPFYPLIHGIPWSCFPCHHENWQWQTWQILAPGFHLRLPGPRRSTMRRFTEESLVGDEFVGKKLQENPYGNPEAYLVVKTWSKTGAGNVTQSMANGW